MIIIHLRMDTSSFVKLRSLKAAIGVSSFEEVIDRALVAYEQFEPIDSLTDRECNAANEVVARMEKILDLRLNLTSKERLDQLVAEDPFRSLSNVIERSLTVLFQIVRNQENMNGPSEPHIEKGLSSLQKLGGPI